MDPNKVLFLSIKENQVIKEGYLNTNIPSYSQYKLWDSVYFLINHHCSEDGFNPIILKLTLISDIADTLVLLFCPKCLKPDGKKVMSLRCRIHH